MSTELRKLIGRLVFTLALGVTVYFLIADNATDVAASVIESHERRMAPVDSHIAVTHPDDEGVSLSALPLSPETLRDIRSYAWCHQKNYRRLHLEACVGVGL